MTKKIFFLILLLPFLLSAQQYKNINVGENLNQRHLFFCLDSIPYSVFMKAKDNGLFKNFQAPSRMISTFPALTNYAWSIILNAGEVEGYQTRYYDPIMNRLEGGFSSLYSKSVGPDSQVLQLQFGYQSWPGRGCSEEVGRKA